MPGIISWPAVVQGNRVSWDTVVTYDFLPTIMDVLGVQRPAAQQNWGFDGRSVMPILRGEGWPERGLGWMFDTPAMNVDKGYGFRYGRWKYVQGSISCSQADCRQPQLYDLETDLGEHTNVAAQNPAILRAIMANFTLWHQSILNSIANESRCQTGPGPSPPSPPPPPAPPSSNCQFVRDSGLQGSDYAHVPGASKEECCGRCLQQAACAAVDFNNNTCHFKHAFNPISRPGAWACKPNK